MGFAASSLSQAAICFSASTERSWFGRKKTNTFALAFAESSFCFPPAVVRSSTFSICVPTSARAWTDGGKAASSVSSANGTDRGLLVAMARG